VHRRGLKSETAWPHLAPRLIENPIRWRPTPRRARVRPSVDVRHGSIKRCGLRRGGAPWRRHPSLSDEGRSGTAQQGRINQPNLLSIRRERLGDAPDRLTVRPNSSRPRSAGSARWWICHPGLYGDVVPAFPAILCMFSFFYYERSSCPLFSAGAGPNNSQDRLPQARLLGRSLQFFFLDHYFLPEAGSSF